jgi:RNA polymerase-binding transcription factor DksA
VVADDDGAREALLARVEQDLADVEEALRGLDDGRYGRCDACGQPLADALLAEHPTARRCAGCDPERTPRLDPSWP